jgi:DNA-binding MarR family transcriptional regulator
MNLPPKILKGLQQAGLGEKATAIYAYLLETGGAYPSTIATATKLNRSTTYKILTDLAVKGLVNEVPKGKKLYYQIEKPTKLLRYTQSQVTLAEDRLENLKAIYPDIEGIFGLLPTKAKVLYFEGLEGVMSVYNEHISVKKSYEMVGFADTARIKGFLLDSYFKKYRLAKEKLRITTRGILPEGEEYGDYASNTYNDVSDPYKPILKFIPKKQFPFQGEITIYGSDRVSIINLEHNIPTAFIIEDESFHRMMRSIFDLVWASLL